MIGRNIDMLIRGRIQGKERIEIDLGKVCILVC